MKTENACWCCGSPLPCDGGSEVTCTACHRGHRLASCGEQAVWRPCEVGGYALEGTPSLTDHGYQCLARDRNDSETVVLTAIRVPDGSLREQLLAQVLPMVGRAHMNIVRLRNAGADGSLVWVVHDRFEAQSLDRWKDSTPPMPLGDLGARRDILCQLAKGLVFLHGCGTPHGRLLPHNILVAADGGVRLMYGGLASLAAHCGSQRATGAHSPPVFSASPYAAPEVAAGGEVSTAADSYSYGAIAYQLLTDTIPRGRFKPLDLLVPGCPSGFSRCVDRCLEVTSSDRPTAEQIVQSQGDATWGASNSISSVASGFTGWLSRLTQSVRKAFRQSPGEANDPGSAEGLARSIAWEALSFGLVGLLVGHVLGMALGTIAMACKFSIGLVVGLHHFLCVAFGVSSAVAGLWRERCLGILKSVAVGRTFIDVVTAAERYRDPQQRAVDALRTLEAGDAPQQMLLAELRLLITSIDEAVTALECTTLNASALPPIHQQLIGSRHHLLGLAAEKAVAERQYGVALEFYKRLATANPDDESIAVRARQLNDLLEKHTSRIANLLGAGRLDDAAKRLRSLAKHFPHDDTLRKLLARYEEQRRLLEDARSVSLAQLVRDNHWHRIGELVDALTLHGLPLGAFDKVVDECETRRALFARQRVEAEAAFKQLGPRRAAAWLSRLRSTIADDPFITQFSNQLSAVAAAQNAMRQEVDSRIAGGRWLAAENAVRSFLMQHELGSGSLVEAVHRIAGHVKAEWSRWRLLLWCIVAGGGFMAFAMLFSTASWHEASSAWSQRIPVPSQLQALVGPGLVRGMQFLAIGVFLSVQLTFVGRHSVALVPVFMGLAVAVAVANALPPAWDAIQRLAGKSPPAALHTVANAVPMMADTACWLALFTAAAACAAGIPSWTPSLITALIAMGAIYGMHGSQVWANLLPEGFAAAAVLAVAGVIGSTRAWFLVSLAGVVASILAISSPLGGHSEFLQRAAPAAVGLFVTGMFVLGKRTAADYLWLTIAVAWACTAGWFVRSFNSPELAQLLTVWMIACGGLAIANPAALGERVRPQDVSRVYLLRMRARRGSLAGCPLVNSRWWKDNRAWHAANSDGGAVPSRAASSADRHDNHTLQPRAS